MTGGVNGGRSGWKDAFGTDDRGHLEGFLDCGLGNRPVFVHQKDLEDPPGDKNT